MHTSKRALKAVHVCCITDTHLSNPEHVDAAQIICEPWERGGGFTPDFESTMSRAQLGLLRPWLSCALYGLTGELKCKMKLKDEEGPVRDAAVRLMPPLPPCCVLVLPVAAPLLAFAAVFAAEMLIPLLACGLPPLPVAAPVLVLATAVFAVVLFPLLPPLPVVAPLIALAAAVFAVVLLPLLPPLPVAAP